MFKCQRCRRITEPGEKSTLIVTETREKVYPPRKGDPGGSGFETVSEIQVCESCAKELGHA